MFCGLGWLSLCRAKKKIRIKWCPKCGLGLFQTLPGWIIDPTAGDLQKNEEGSTDGLDQPFSARFVLNVKPIWCNEENIKFVLQKSSQLWLVFVVASFLLTFKACNFFLCVSSILQCPLALSVPLCSGSLCPQTSERLDGGLFQRPETCGGHGRSSQCLPADHTVTDQRYGE